MLFGHSRPTGVAWSVASSGGTGAAILSPTAQLDDGRPGTVTRMQWFNGTQTTVNYLVIRAAWTGAIVPRLFGIVNTSLPVGTKISAAFHRPGDAVGTYPYVPTVLNAGQRIVEGPRGERTAWIMVAPGASPVDAMQLQIYNDVNGTASIPASSQFTIGEVVIMAGDDVCIQPGANMDEIDTTTAGYSTSRQPYAAPGTVYRQVTFKLGVAYAPDYFATYRALFAKLDRGKTGAFVELYRDSTGAFSADLLHQNAMLGVVTKLPGALHKSGKVFESNTVVVQETPIPT